MAEHFVERNGLKVSVEHEYRKIPEIVRRELHGISKNVEKRQEISGQDEIELHTTMKLDRYPSQYEEILNQQPGGEFHGLAVLGLTKIMMREEDCGIDDLQAEPQLSWSSLVPDLQANNTTVLGEAGFVEPDIGFPSPNSLAVMDRFSLFVESFVQNAGVLNENMRLYHIPFRHLQRKKKLSQVFEKDIPEKYGVVTIDHIERDGFSNWRD